MEYFVILKKGVGSTWTEGQGVTSEEFANHVTGMTQDGTPIKGVDVNRLLAMQAIRHATQHEVSAFKSGEKKVVFKDSVRPSHHHDIHQQTEVIAHLRNRIEDLERQLSAKNLAVLSTTPNKPVADMLRNKEEKIEAMQLEMKAMRKQIKEMKTSELVEVQS